MSLWDKVDYGLATNDDSESATRKEEVRLNREELKQFWKWRRPLLDVAGTTLWVYAMLKVFVTDVDASLLGDLADYRFFFFLFAAAVLALCLRRTPQILMGLAYVALFPFVIVLWKLPRRLFKARSSIGFLAVGNAITSFVGDVKHSLVTTALAAGAGLTIATAKADVLLAAAACLLLVLVCQAVVRTILFSIKPSRFLRLQHNAIRNAVDSPTGRGLMVPDAALRSDDVAKFNKAQQIAFTQSLGFAVLTHRVIYFWAAQLEQYRRGPSMIFFNALAYAWLLVRCVVGLAFLNFALYRAQPSAYDFENEPSFLLIVRYAIASLYGSEVDALHAQSDLANVVSIGAFVIGVLVLGSLVVSSTLSFRAAREQSDIAETVSAIRGHGTDLDARVRQDYEITVDEAHERLKHLQWSLMGVIDYFSTRIPPPGEVGRGSRRPR